ncbi:hypothetical protein [Rhodococcus sp. BH5]|uniref:hypothetical protein n=1 Tax=Rhodococcus sp. BH5 TaxID=2871702 RepID=UPI0022CD5F3A|nr:hypothetical protein [Rhodococcus sp. BH5]MCZ9631335.1 hypothetical protein [Rhodococcus sp. BH5]
MSEIRSQATPARDELAEKVFDLLVTAESMGEQRRNVIAHGIAMGLEDAGWSKPRTVKFSELGSLPIGVVIRNNEGGTIAVRESEKDWFIPGLDYEIELWELENPEGEDFTILFTPGSTG